MLHVFQAMENHEEPSVLRVITDYDTQDHGLDVMRDALNYQVEIQIINALISEKVSDI